MTISDQLRRVIYSHLRIAWYKNMRCIELPILVCLFEMNSNGNVSSQCHERETQNILNKDVYSKQAIYWYNYAKDTSQG